MSTPDCIRVAHPGLTLLRHYLNSTFIHPAFEVVDGDDDIEDGIINTFIEEDDPASELPPKHRVPHQAAIDALELSSSIVCSPAGVRVIWKSCYSGKNAELRDIDIVRRQDKPNGGSLSTYTTPNTHSLAHLSVLSCM